MLRKHRNVVYIISKELSEASDLSATQREEILAVTTLPTVICGYVQKYILRGFDIVLERREALS